MYSGLHVQLPLLLSVFIKIDFSRQDILKIHNILQYITLG